MPTAEARVETTRPRRYLVTLCKHFDHRARTLPGVDAHVDWTESSGVADFGWGRCTLATDPDALILRAEAPDQANLERVELLVAGMLERMARRDRLRVTWDPAPDAGNDPRRRPPHRKEDSRHG
jgi:hypothetical protein